MNQTGCKMYYSTSAAWRAMYLAIARTKRTIYWELYTFEDDAVGGKFYDLLEKKARQGVDVKLIIDAFGTMWLPRERIRRLRAAGVDLRFFYKDRAWHKWYKGLWRRFITRNHRKILILDEQEGFIGGVNVAAYMKKWKDIHVRLRGKAVVRLLILFAHSYALCGGAKERFHKYTRLKKLRRLRGVEYIFDYPHRRKSRSKKIYIEALADATEHVILFSPYYCPGTRFYWALKRAVLREVQVDLLVPAKTDVWLATYAAYPWFALLKRIGVRVHVMDDMMHAKGVVVDEKWVMVGSSNLNKMSFYHNYEANVRLRDPELVMQTRGVVLGWMQESRLFCEKKFDRDWWHRCKERFSLWLFHLWYGKE